MSRVTCDVAVVGGGPAGMAAAVAATRAGLAVALIDAGARLGGQYFRHPAPGFHASRPGAFHRDFGRFERLRDALEGRAEILIGHRVWAAERREGVVAVHCLAGDRDERPETVIARRLLIATGAHDRPLPFPGWDLPGVMTAGGAQALLKGDLVAAGRRVVVAGTGPFLLPVATGLARAGTEVVGVFEANARATLGPALTRHPGKLAEAARYGYDLARYGIPYRGRHAVIAAHGEMEHGETGVARVTVAEIGRDWRPYRSETIACDTLAVSYGFTAQLDLPLQLGCATRSDGDGSPVVRVDAGMRTSVEGVYAAGETTGVGGAELAEVEGWIAGRAMAADLGRPVRPAPTLSRRRDRLTAFADAMHAAYPVRDGWTTWLRDDTLICRCEEVPYARVREALDLGAADARAVKLLARPGMGWCQGRMCGYAVSRLAGAAPDPQRRPIAQPLRLGDLAALEAAEDPRDRATTQAAGVKTPEPPDPDDHANPEHRG